MRTVAPMPFSTATEMGEPKAKIDPEVGEVITKDESGPIGGPGLTLIIMIEAKITAMIEKLEKMFMFVLV